MSDKIQHVILNHKNITTIKHYLDKHGLSLMTLHFDDNLILVKLDDFIQFAYRLRSLNEFTICERLFRQIYIIQKDIHGVSSHETIKALDDFIDNTMSLFMRGAITNTDFIEEIYKNIIKLKIQVFTLCHHETLHTMMNLVTFYNLTWSLDQSIVVIKTILENCDNVLNFDYFAFSSLLMTFSNNLFLSNNIDDAKHYHVLAIQTSQRYLNDKQKEQIYGMVDDFFKMYLKN